MKHIVLVTGANGQLGNELRLCSANAPDMVFIFTDENEMDISQPNDVRKILNLHKPNFLVNCAAYTAVDKAESEVEKAELINTIAPGILCELCNESGTQLIHVSTDYVFDGYGNVPYRETDTCNPNGVYAKTKYQGELLILEKSTNACIIRTSWLYSTFGHNFLKTIIRLSATKPEISVVFDQIGTPTYAADLAKAIVEIIPQMAKNPLGKPEIFHYSNEGVASWFDFAKAIVDINGLPTKVMPIETKDFPTPAPRPVFSVMNKEKIRNFFNIEIPYWRESLEIAIKNLSKT